MINPGNRNPYYPGQGYPQNNPYGPRNPNIIDPFSGGFGMPDQNNPLFNPGGELVGPNDPRFGGIGTGGQGRHPFNPQGGPNIRFDPPNPFGGGNRFDPSGGMGGGFGSGGMGGGFGGGMYG